ncbi:NAD-dependent succinate-semialdehyde dehydrogenase [Aromatoleum diolicum]|uniref:Succinate-semialdehyde dehydrogenase n=1 Tax=Aromatoleum diolicum TaxID=75796 RepID=A0ABX1QD82_9RHOO|nr:succinate-semialdehyde dehydrogenase [Aromatoleum diolicum]
MRLPLSDPQHGLRNRALIRNVAYIGGDWVGSDDGTCFEVRNPADGSLVAEVPNMGAEETRRAIQAAVVAFVAWRRFTPQQRSTILRRWQQLILDSADDLACLLTTEQGKALNDAHAEVLQAAGFLEWYAEEGKRLTGGVLPTSHPGRRGWVLREPIGVCAAITPWNYPAATLARKFAPALAAGCTVVLKPAEQTPLTALALAALAEEAGLPPGVFNVVTGDGDAAEAIGRELSTHPAIRMLSFTGSSEVGRQLMRQSADTLKNLSLELGGHAPFVVFDDADLDVAVESAINAKFRNAGQMCVAANRFLVQDGIHDAFATRLAERAKGLKVGPGLTPGVLVGPLIDHLALTKVQRHVDDAIAHGAKVLTGGQRFGRDGTFFEPTVLTGVTSAMIVAREETFGPVAPLMRFSTEADAIAMSNATDYGLASYVFTRDISRIWRLTEAIEAGVVAVNAGSFTTEAAPFGGVKQSGLGREGGSYGIESYLSIKHVSLGLG